MSHGFPFPFIIHTAPKTLNLELTDGGELFCKARFELALPRVPLDWSQPVLVSLSATIQLLPTHNITVIRKVKII